MSIYFSLYACCIPVKGAKRSIVCDLQRDSYVFIPEVLFDILTDLTSSVYEIKAQFQNEYDSMIDQYFEYLISKDMGFFSDSPANFPKLEMGSWSMANVITNAVIDYDKFSDHQLDKVSKELSELLCEALEVRCFDRVTDKQLEEIIGAFTDSTLRSIELTIHDDSYLDDEYVSDLLLTYPRLTKIIIHSAEKDKFETQPTCYVIRTKDNIYSEACCGAVSAYFFSSKTESFIESQHHNSCLNRKISIDKRGFIRNCPSLTESFGHIRDTSLPQVVKAGEIKKYWNITKDEIEICKDCEFRHICQDCRAYTKKPGGLYSKPLKCNYDPYSAVWN